jgi:hypothetical protein
MVLFASILQCGHAIRRLKKITYSLLGLPVGRKTDSLYSLIEHGVSLLRVANFGVVSEIDRTVKDRREKLFFFTHT